MQLTYMDYHIKNELLAIYLILATKEEKRRIVLPIKRIIAEKREQNNMWSLNLQRTISLERN
jgi:hypothetical protein